MPLNLHVPLIMGLGAVALVRPLARILAEQLGAPETPLLAVLLTALVSAVWVLVVGLGRIARPVLTLVAAGLVYGVLSIVLSGVLSPLLTGTLQGPLATPVAIVPVLVTNAVWGLLAGGAALLLQRLRAARAGGRSLQPR